MESPQKSDDGQNSLQLLHAYDSDSSEETDDLNNLRVTSAADSCSDTVTFPSLPKNNNVSTQGFVAEVLNTCDGSTACVASKNDNSSDTNNIDSDLVIKNNMKNSTEHGPVDPELMAWTQDVKDSIVSDATGKNNNSELIKFETLPPRDNQWDQNGSSSEDEDSQDSDSDSSSEWGSLKGADSTDSDDVSPNVQGAAAFTNKNIAPKVKGELGLEDLPPIEDLTISVPNTECMVIGTIYDIVDQLVIVEALPNKPTLDLDTVLFLENGSRTLGHVFDVFGQVNQPFYCIRFNSKEHIKDKGISCGMAVYCAPKSEYTHLVFARDLMKVKGSDASWKNDTEPPTQFLEFSDDEEERKVKHSKKSNNNAAAGSSTGNPSKRHKPTPYEERMNKKNLEKTAEFNLRNQLPVQQGIGFGRGQVVNRFTRSLAVDPMDMNWTPNNSFFVSGSPYHQPQHRFQGPGQFEAPRMPPNIPGNAFPLNRPRFNSHPPPGLWFVNRFQSSPWSTRPPPGFSPI